jgi:hypothetical protein
MGSKYHPNLRAMAEDVQRVHPGAEVEWDTDIDPHMVTITLGRAKARGFLESKDIAERGEMYRNWLDRMLAQLVDSQSGR